jgi:hypothetical protein
MEREGIEPQRMSSFASSFANSYFALGSDDEVVVEFVATRLYYFSRHSHSIGGTFILESKEHNACMWQTGTVDKLAEILIVRNYNAVFINRDV